MSMAAPHDPLEFSRVARKIIILRSPVVGPYVNRPLTLWKCRNCRESHAKSLFLALPPGPLELARVAYKKTIPGPYVAHPLKWGRVSCKTASPGLDPGPSGIVEGLTQNRMS